MNYDFFLNYDGIWLITIKASPFPQISRQYCYCELSYLGLSSDFATPLLRSRRWHKLIPSNEEEKTGEEEGGGQLQIDRAEKIRL